MMRLDQKGKLGIRLILKEVWKIIEHVISNLLEGCQVTVSAPFIINDNLWQKNAFIILSINGNQFRDQTYG